jgi:two-component system, NtrC family, nitrogen regulation sensor histidine kinase NtrY
MSTVVVFLESVAMAGAAGFGVWAWRAKQAATAGISAMSRELEEQRSAGQRREGLLRTVVDSTPVAIVLFGETGSIVFTNRSARDLFFDGMEVDGENFLSMIKRSPPSLRQALLSEGDELFSVEGAAGRETFHLSRRHVEGGQTLIAVRSVTQEITRHEVASLKKVIRIMGHEINNSLGPIASLASSAKAILQRPEHSGKLPAMLDRVQERALHLQGFLNGYAKLAKLPPSKPGPVLWAPFLDGLRGFWPELEVGNPPARPGFFDRAQIQQVLFNLIKNAYEAGGPKDQVEVVVEASEGGGCLIAVMDRGPGVSDEVMESLFVPFFTTKPTGSGLGLALSREIVGQHQGRLALARRAGGGMSVSIWLPDAEGDPARALDASRAKLTLTRS